MSDPAQVPPSEAPRRPSITITVGSNGQYELDYQALPPDPVILCGLLEVAKKIVLDKFGPKPSGLVLQNGPQLQLPRIPASLLNGGRR